MHCQKQILEHLQSAELAIGRLPVDLRVAYAHNVCEAVSFIRKARALILQEGELKLVTSEVDRAAVEKAFEEKAASPQETSFEAGDIADAGG